MHIFAFCEHKTPSNDFLIRSLFCLIMQLTSMWASVDTFHVIWIVSKTINYWEPFASRIIRPNWRATNETTMSIKCASNRNVLLTRFLRIFQVDPLVRISLNICNEASCNHVHFVVHSLLICWPHARDPSQCVEFDANDSNIAQYETIAAATYETNKHKTLGRSHLQLYLRVVLKSLAPYKWYRAIVGYRCLHGYKLMHSWTSCNRLIDGERAYCSAQTTVRCCVSRERE